MVSTWQGRLIQGFQQGKGMSRGQMRTNFDAICADFASIPVTGEQKVRVGVVGEIYVKFSPLGNNNLEDFLLSEGAEPVVPGLTDFMIFKIYNRVVDVDLYGGKWIKKAACKIFMGYVENCQKDMIQALENSGRFRAPGTFQELHSLVHGYLGDGNKMGEGWLLTAEMLELIHSGTPNIVCTQPFGCLPNHIVGKGMIRKLKDDYPFSNIVAIDYDPGATKINQENRIKLMLANAASIAGQHAAREVPLPRHEEEGLQLKTELQGELLEYQVCRQVAAQLGARNRMYLQFVRAPVKIEADNTYRLTHRADELYAAYQDAAGRGRRRLPPPAQAFSGIVSRRVVSVGSRIIHILKSLYRSGRASYESLFTSSGDRSELVATFLAVLELVKARRITVEGDEVRFDRSKQERRAPEGEPPAV